MKEIEANQKNWDSRVDIHKLSRKIYNIENFKKGDMSFVSNEYNELKEFINPANHELLHLQCHFGLDTISFSRLGAKATGVDFSGKAIELAKELSQEVGLDTQFVQSNIYLLDLDKEFDIIFTSIGVLPWLPDLQKWAQIVSKHLKNGGIFYLKDGHPIIHAIDYDAKDPSELKLKYPYFSDGKSFKYEEPYTYAHDGTDELLEHSTHYEWQHTISDIVNALISEGLRIIHMKESPYGYFKSFEFMSQDKDGRWVLPDEYRDSFPLTITIIATK